LDSAAAARKRAPVGESRPPARPPALSGATLARAAPRWTEIDWTPHVRDATVLGRRLRYVDYGDGPPLLLVHGLGGCWQWWLENIEALGVDNRVIAVDLPGFGASEPLPPPGEMATHAEALVALLDALGVEQVVLCAHSMGGLIALRLAADHTARLRGLVLVCAGGILLDARRLALVTSAFRASYALLARPGVLRAFALRPRLRRLLFGAALGDPGALAPELAARIVPMLAAPGFMDALRSGVRVANDVRAEEIDVPALLIWGDLDPILPVAGARELAERMPNARLEVMAGTGHGPMLERPGEFSELVRGHARDSSTFVHGGG
jgi:pimeloyl-ACP methyl ester carboxylesterase